MIQPCPHCQQPIEPHSFFVDAFQVLTWQCGRCGDVVIKEPWSEHERTSQSLFCLYGTRHPGSDPFDYAGVRKQIQRFFERSPALIDAKEVMGLLERCDAVLTLLEYEVWVNIDDGK